jgi:hypothetical protein
MLNYKIAVPLAIFCAISLSTASAPAENQPVTRYYQIISGTYRECCGIAGGQTVTLPTQRQAFIRLSVDTQNNIASMAFLAEDMRTVFATFPCPPDGGIQFDFPLGFIVQDQIVFHVDPGPPPYSTYWNYSVSNSSTGLRINGVVGALRSDCADVPTQFTHSNVVARIEPLPRLDFLRRSTNGAAQLFIQGHAGRTNIIEASGDLISWTPVSTNVMVYSLCPICPFAIFEDTASTNLSQRFYRAVEIP